MTATIVEFLLGLVVGLGGGLSSGLLGVSPGGALTVFSALLSDENVIVAAGVPSATAPGARLTVLPAVLAKVRESPLTAS